jgi:hypothetical protein
MTTGNEKYIKDKITPMTTEEARKAITRGEFGPSSSEDYRFACSLLANKEATLREAREAEDLTISRKALQASEEANKLSLEANKLALDANSIASNARSEARRANIIAITAMILSVAIAIIAIILPLLTTK